MSRRRNPIPARAWWVGGLVAGVAAVGGAVYLAVKASALSPTSPSSGVTPGNFVTYNVPAGNSNAQISYQNGLYLALPTGAVLTNWMLDGSIQTNPASGPIAIGAGMSVGQHSVTVSWVDTTGTAQVGNIALTVTS